MVKHKKTRSISFFNSRLISIVSTALVLFLLGIILLVGVLGNELSDYVKENISFTIILNESSTDKQIAKIQEELGKQPFIKTADYISKEQAAKEIEEELGENPETFLGFNPFQASIEVKLHSAYANTDSLPAIEKKLTSYSGISELLYRQDMMQVVDSNIRRLSIVLISLTVILMIISFVLISNTIRLLIYSKRFLIHTMKLVGATPSFIRRPLIKYNMVSGFIAGLLAIGLLCGTIYYFKGEIGSIIMMVDHVTLAIVFAIILVAGILLSVIFTIIAVNRYLRMSVDKMYYV